MERPLVMERPNFTFRRREEKLDWKKLAALDVNRVAQTVDFRALQENVRQVTYCDAAREFDADRSDPNLVKVFRVAQLIIEYMLQSQDFLASNLAGVEERLNAALEELEACRSRSRREQQELSDLRRSLRSQTSSSVINLAGHQRCHICQKVFINVTYLQSHMMRRHNHMVSKQLSSQTLASSVAHQQSERPLESELEELRQRLLTTERLLADERRRVAALESESALRRQADRHSAKDDSDSESHPAAASGPGSGSGSGSGPRHGPADRDARLMLRMEQQAEEIRQLREELERQRRQLPGASADHTRESGPDSAEPGPSTETDSQVKRDVVLLESKLEAQERYWQAKLRALREKHDAELGSMKQALVTSSGAPRGSAEYVNIDSAPEEEEEEEEWQAVGGREYVNVPAGRGGWQRGDRDTRPTTPPDNRRPRPIISSHRRSRSVSSYRRLKFADDEVDEERQDRPTGTSLSTGAIGGRRGRDRSRGREEAEAELAGRLMELGIEPGTRRLSSGLMVDKLRHLQAARRSLGYGDLRRQVDESVTLQLGKTQPPAGRGRSTLAVLARGVLSRGTGMSRSLVSLGSRGRAALAGREQTAGTAGRRATSLSPAASHTLPHQTSRYDEESCSRQRECGKFRFRNSASKHILERFTRKGRGQSSLIKSTRIQRVDSGLSLEDDRGDPGGRREKLWDEKVPCGRQSPDSDSREPPAERRASVESRETREAVGLFQRNAEKLSTSAGAASQEQATSVSAVGGVQERSPTGSYTRLPPIPGAAPNPHGQLNYGAAMLEYSISDDSEDHPRDRLQGSHPSTS